MKTLNEISKTLNVNSRVQMDVDCEVAVGVKFHNERSLNAHGLFACDFDYCEKFCIDDIYALLKRLCHLRA